MQSSAAAQLVGQKLVLAPTSGGLPAWSDATKAAFRPLLSRYDAFLRLVPESGAVTAVWVIDPGTGSATAVAADGSGGGDSECHVAQESLAGMLNSAVSMVSVACALGGSPGLRLPSSQSVWIGRVGLRLVHQPGGYRTRPGGGLLGAMLSWGRLPFETAEDHLPEADALRRRSNSMSVSQRGRAAGRRLVQATRPDTDGHLSFASLPAGAVTLRCRRGHRGRAVVRPGRMAPARGGPYLFSRPTGPT